MTNHWVDMQHARTILVEGSNVAENHPMAFKWIRVAQEHGAKIIHVDPRYTRTSATADVYARIRPGTDAAFLNTMINHILVNKLYDEDFVTVHTNALFLGDVEFGYFGVTGFDRVPAWHDAWRGQSAPPQLVRIRVRFASDDARTWPELVVAQRITADVGCRYDPLTNRCQGR